MALTGCGGLYNNAVELQSLTMVGDCLPSKGLPVTSRGRDINGRIGMLEGSRVRVWLERNEWGGKSGVCLQE